MLFKGHCTPVYGMIAISGQLPEMPWRQGSTRNSMSCHEKSPAIMTHVLSTELPDGKVAFSSIENKKKLICVTGTHAPLRS